MPLPLVIGIWCAPVVAVVVLIGHAVWVESCTRRRYAREDAARDVAVAKRLAEGAEVEWLYSIPTMKWDPEGWAK